MPTTIPTIMDQISAEKTKVSERLARLDADREKIATQLTDLETNPVPPNTVTVCTVMAQPTSGELDRERAYQTCLAALCSSERATPRRSTSHRVCRRAPGSDPR